MVEPLEDRRLLAILNLDIQLWEDDSGSKGNSIEPVDPNATPLVFKVDQGQEFFVQVLTKDQPNPPPGGSDPPNRQSVGIDSLELDLDWNTFIPPADQMRGEIQYADASPPEFPDVIPVENLIVTREFIRQRFVDEFVVDRGADNLRGGTNTAADNTRPIGQQGCDWGDRNASGQHTQDCREFSLLRFEATTAGKTNFKAEVDGSLSFVDGARLDNDPKAEVIIYVDDASISGFVYVDVDMDGERDVHENGAPIELGLPKVRIELYRDGQLVKTDFTGPDGWYHFEHLEPGIYDIVEAEQPHCFIDGTESPGIILPPNVSRGIAGNDRITDIELKAGEHGIEYNFGEKGLKAACINKTMFLNAANLRQDTVYGPLNIKSTVVPGTSEDDDIVVQVQNQAILVTVNGDQTTILREDPEIIVSIEAGEGQDKITLTGTDENDAAHVQPTYPTYRNDYCVLPPECTWDYAVEAISVEDVTVDAGGGTDLGVIRDSAGDDSLRPQNGSVTLEWLIDDELDLISFEKARAISTRGGNDRVYGPLPLEVALFGNWAEL